MKKYLTVARAEWLDAFQYYQEVIIWIIIEALPILVMSSLWLSTGGVNSFHQISFLVTYYVLIFVISRFTGFYFEQRMQDEVRDGTFSRYLSRPLSVQKYLLWNNLGGKSFTLFFLMLPVLLFFFLLFRNYLIAPHPLNLFLFIISLVEAYFIQFSISLLAASCSFFMEQSFAVNHLHWVLDSVAGGYMLPLTFFPAFLKNICLFLPFSSVYFTPVTIYTGQIDLQTIVTRLFFSLVWAVVLYWASSLVFKIGVKRYSAVGG